MSSIIHGVLTRDFADFDADCAAEDARFYAAKLRVCPECGLTGGHYANCPETPDDDDDEDE